MEKKNIFMIVNHDWFFLSHRKAVADGAIKVGYDVTLVTIDTGRRQEIVDMGIHFIDFNVNPTGKNPMQELQTLCFLIKLFRKNKPDVVHNVGLKNFLWGGIAARVAKVPVVVNAVSGLGVMFSGEKLGMVAKLMIEGMKWSMRRKNAYAIFQNADDLGLFRKYKVVTSERQEVYIKGSGCNLEEYAFSEIPTNTLETKAVVLFTGRMVREKGIVTLIEAAEILRSEYENKVEFRLCGGLHNNPKAFKKEEIEAMCDGKYISWMGLRHDIPEQLKQCSIVAFPSYYREGVPKSLIEACAVGRPIITCDSVGCRDCVDEGKNGFLIQPRDSKKLAEYLKRLVDDPQLMVIMGAESRKKAEREFDIRDVVRIHLGVYNHCKETVFD